ncbi:hypothetical protein AB6A40_004219 [Gnathostoma spinigerum]|uniref:Uncharacterized protein n=1 Tax=Gnathostoma spinigerum TaxID=75299 RepID=A0ABD6EBV0_9BILA
MISNNNSLFRIQTIEELRHQLDIERKWQKKLEENLEMKDEQNLNLQNEIRRMRTAAFGSAETEIHRLETQLRYREVQLEKLRKTCTLLQLELPDDIKVKKDFNDEEIISTDHSDNAAVISAVDTAVETEQNAHALNMKSVEENESNIVTKDKAPDTVDEDETNKTIMTLRQNILSLVEKLDMKNEQLKELEKTIKDTTIFANEQQSALLRVNEEFAKFKEEMGSASNEEMKARIAECEVEIEELKRALEALRYPESELKKNYEENVHRLIGERIKALQLTRKIRSLENCRHYEMEEAAKLKEKLENAIITNARQAKIASYEMDCLSIEMARLQRIVLHSVPLEEYNNIINQFKSMLLKGIFPESNIAVEVSSGEMGIEIMRKFNDGIEKEKILAQLEQSKREIQILSEHVEFNKRQNEKLRKENSELKQFLEEVEYSSEVKSMVVAIERRFLRALSEKSDSICDEQTTFKQLNRLHEEFFKQRTRWTNDRKKFLTIIRTLQMELKRIHTTTMQTLTLEQVIKLREEMAAIEGKQSALNNALSEIEEKKEDLSQERRNVEALKESIDVIKENNFDMAKIRQSLHASQFNFLSASEQLRSAKIQIEERNRKIFELEEQISVQREKIENLINTFIDLDLFSMDVPSEILDETALLLRSRETKNDINEEMEKRNSSKEVDSAVGESANEDEKENQNRFASLPTRTVVFDDTKEYEKKLQIMKETAEICIQNYKDQLEYKDVAIKKYKELLETFMQDQPHQEIDNARKLAEIQQPKHSEDFINKGNGNSEVAREVLRLRREIEELEAANSLLNEELLSGVYQPKDREFHDIAVETDIPRLENVGSDRKKITESEDFSRDSINTPSSVPGTELPLSNGTSTKLIGNTVRVKKQTDENTLKTDKCSMHEEQILTQRNEIHRLRTRIASLISKNTALEEACEEIRASALAQIGRKYDVEENTMDDVEKTQLKTQNEKMKADISVLRRTIRSQKEQIERLQSESRSTPHKDELENWNVRKKYEETIETLRKKLNESNKRIEELTDRVEKRNKRIEQMSHEERLRINEIGRMKSAMKTLKDENNDFKTKENTMMETVEEAKSVVETYCKQIDAYTEENAQLRDEIKTLKYTIENEEIERKKEKEEEDKREESKPTRNSVKETVVDSTANGRRQMETVDEVKKMMKAKLTATKKSLEKKLNSVRNQYETVSTQYVALQQKYEVLLTENKKLLENEKQRKAVEDSAAVAVLRDKLMAKEKKIEKLSQQIEQLQREKWLRML